jgi:hypothetical protein
MQAVEFGHLAHPSTSKMSKLFSCIAPSISIVKPQAMEFASRQKGNRLTVSGLMTPVSAAMA